MNKKSNLKLWLLEPQDDLPHNDNPFVPWPDTCDSMIICAETEDEARAIAQENGEVEIMGKWTGKAVWTNPKYTTCKELLPTEKGVIMINTR